MLGIVSSYTIDLSDLEYPSDECIIRFRIKTEPEISRFLQDPSAKILTKTLQFLRYEGEPK